MPIGMNDDNAPWERVGDYLNTKYPYVCHSELNAILNARGINLTGATLYVTLFPCNECSKAIIQSGIKKVIYESDKYADTDGVKASKRIFDECGIEYNKYQTKNKSIEIEL